VLDLESFRALCKRVAEEDDDVTLEILKERMRVLLADRESGPAYYPNAFVN
jgi:hypothetical protein